MKKKYAGMFTSLLLTLVTGQAMAQTDLKAAVLILRQYYGEQEIIVPSLPDYRLTDIDIVWPKSNEMLKSSFMYYFHSEVTWQYTGQSPVFGLKYSKSVSVPAPALTFNSQFTLIQGKAFGPETPHISCNNPLNIQNSSIGLIKACFNNTRTKPHPVWQMRSIPAQSQNKQISIVAAATSKEEIIRLVNSLQTISQYKLKHPEF